MLTRVALASGLLALAVGLTALSRAGRRYLSGAVDEVRAVSRRAGIVAGAGAALAAFACVVDSRLAAAAFLGSGTVALLGGLSGKPAPAAGFAIVLGLGALAALAVSGLAR